MSLLDIIAAVFFSHLFLGSFVVAREIREILRQLNAQTKRRKDHARIIRSI